jgi:RHS repeat-associated protein
MTTTTGQQTGYCYDAVGNLILNATCPTGSFTPTYSYNAENQLTSTAGVTYMYDGDGKRVQKSNGKLYWYGLESDPLDETDLAGNTSNPAFNEYIFFNGARIARRDSANNVNYCFADHLGTARIVTNAGGTILDDSDFYPFGGERPITSSSGNPYKFTGKERDSESGLDNFGARYDSSYMGRFMTPDWSDSPEPIPYADLGNPQTLNLYSYAGNNPISGADDDGHDFGANGPDDYYARQNAPKPAATCGLLCRLKLIFLSKPQNTSPTPDGAVSVPFPLVFDSTGTLATGAAGAITVGSAYLLITNVTDTLIENNRGKEQLAAIESLVAVENGRILFSRNKDTLRIIQGLLAAAQTEVGKMSGPEGDPHHKSEVKAMLDRAKQLAQRLPGKAREAVLQAIRSLEGTIPGGPR